MSEPASRPKKALFVCLGNICRSPMAEAVFLHLLDERKVRHEWEVDSAATGDWHVGSRPDSRAMACLRKHRIDTDHCARLVTYDDFLHYGTIFGMDESNLRDLRGIAPPNAKAAIELLGSYDPEKETIIRDPYYDRGSDGFEKVYEQCVRCCNSFLDQVYAK